MAVTTTNLGVITAYGDAVAAGYTGTKAEWQALMASYATVGQQAVDAKNAAVAAKDTAVSKATEATTAANTATTKASEASASAQSIAQSASQIAQNTSDISELKEDLTNNISTYSSNAGLFEYGNINHTGASEVYAPALRTTDYLDPSIVACKTNTGYDFRVKAFNKSTDAFVGTWDGTRFTDGVLGSKITSFNFSGYDYAFKVVLFRSDTADIDLSEATNVLFESYVDTSLTQKYRSADAYITGQKFASLKTQITNIENVATTIISPVIEQGAISAVNGNNEISTIRIRTKNKIPLDADYKVSIGSLQSYQVMVYHGDTYSSAESYLSYTSEPITLKQGSGKYFRVCARNTDNSTITPEASTISIERFTPLTNINYLMETCKPANINCFSVSHRGNNSTTQENHNKLEGYIQAAKEGFDYGECDLKETSDGVLVCCHDTTFVDSTSGETVTIATSTYEELLAHDYHGGKIAKFEDIVYVCKLYGMGLCLDQLGTASIIIKTCAIIKKYQMIEHTIWSFGIGADDAISLVRNRFSNATLAIVGASATLDQLITYANSKVTSESRVYVDAPYTLATPEQFATAIADFAQNVYLFIWTVDNLDTLKPYIPYISGYVSNVFSYREVYKTFLF